MRRHWWAGRLGSMAIVVASLVVGFFICEVVLRVFGSGENVRATATLGIFAPDAELRWVLKPNLSVNRRWAGREVLIRTDADGHRVPNVVVPNDSAGLIAISGDSYVFGNEVNAEETFAYLAGQLSRSTSVNLGVGGYALGQACLALQRFLAKQAGVTHAFLVIFVGNDVQFGPFPAKATHVDEYGHLSNASAGRWTGMRSFALRHSRTAFYIQAVLSRIRPAVPDSTSAVEARNYRWIYDDSAFTLARLEPHRRALAALRDEARLRGVPLTVVVMPERSQVYGSLSDLPNRKLLLLLSELRIPAIDLLPEMRKAAAARPALWHDLVEGHLSPEGNRLVAGILVARLSR